MYSASGRRSATSGLGACDMNTIDHMPGDGNSTKPTRRKLDPPTHAVPAPGAFHQAVRIGLGWGMIEDEVAEPELAAGRLVDVAPGKYIDVPLYWQHWKLESAILDALTVARVITDDQKRGIRFYTWAKTSQHLLYLQDEGGSEDWHIYAVGLDGGPVRDLTPFAGVSARIEQLSLDHPEADADVALAAKILARVEHIAALDHEIELVGRPHRGERGAAGKRKRCRRAEKITA